MKGRGCCESENGKQKLLSGSFHYEFLEAGMREDWEEGVVTCTYTQKT